MPLSDCEALLVLSTMVPGFHSSSQRTSTRVPTGRGVLSVLTIFAAAALVRGMAVVAR